MGGGQGYAVKFYYNHLQLHHNLVSKITYNIHVFYLWTLMNFDKCTVYIYHINAGKQFFHLHSSTRDMSKIASFI